MRSASTFGRHDFVMARRALNWQCVAPGLVRRDVHQPIINSQKDTVMGCQKTAAMGLIMVLMTLAVKADDSVRFSLDKSAPKWIELQGTDGKLHSWQEYESAKATVVVFLCNHCPCAKSYEKRFVRFTQEYRDKGVRFVAFNSDSSETMEQMKQRAKDSGFNFDYLKDDGQAVAKAMKAQTTPHVFVLNAERKVVFSGAFDDDKSGTKVTRQFVRDAVDDVLMGRAVKTSESKLCGCAITFDN